MRALLILACIVLTLFGFSSQLCAIATPFQLNGAKADEQPLVSACMITYDHERYITEAIEGALSQDTGQPYELVIAEDCSTDKKRQIVLHYHISESIQTVSVWSRRPANRATRR
jgi:hypothetical protein